MKNRYSVILGNLGNTCDRFLPTGYKDRLSREEMIRQAAEIEGIEGLELVGSWDVAEENVNEIERSLKMHNLECVSIIPDLFSQKRWGKGSFSSKDKEIRRQAHKETRSAALIARRLGCPLLNLWLGQDGYDYPLQSDYRQERLWLVEGIRAVAEEFPDIKFALEYKMMEPRTHSFQARAADTLLMVQETGRKNVGVCIDVGHSLMAHENVSEAAVILQHYGERLFHMHFNDNYRTWDDDMIVGSIHLVEYIELQYWLRESGYAGWYSMDQYPYREDGQAAVRESVLFLRFVESFLDETRTEELRNLIGCGDATQVSRWMRESILSRSQRK